MSGICGIHHLDGKQVEPETLHGMAQSMAHRGPDGIHYWIDGHVGLAHLALHTNRETSGEQQPTVGQRGSQVVVSNARIDNRDELIHPLILKGFQVEKDSSDASLILAAYEAWGEDCPEHLLGDFAFAIWDGREGQMFCARDPLGMRSFCYSFQPGKLFAFASEVRAVLSLPLLPGRINHGRIADYLVDSLEGIDKTCTFFEEVYRLPPATSLTARPDSLSFHTYWRLDPSREIRLGSDEEYAEALREVFTRAVHRRLEGVHQPASMLSGGLDSSMVVSVARRLVGQTGTAPLHTFSGVADDKARSPETQAIKAVLAQGAVKAHTISPAHLEPFLPDLERIWLDCNDLFDATFADLIPTLYSAARQQGIRTLLDGIDGTLVVSQPVDYPAYLLRAGRCYLAIREVLGLSRNLYDGAQSSWQLLRNNLALAYAPGWLRQRRIRKQSASTLPEIFDQTIINPNFAHSIRLAERVEALASHTPERLFETASEAHASRLNHPYLSVGVERYERIAAANQVEPRSPFLDRELVEFCLALPAEQKLHHGWTKMVMRRAAQGTLPQAVCWRRDSDHLHPAFFLAYFRLLRPRLREIAAGGFQEAKDFINLPVLLQAYRFIDEQDDQVFTSPAAIPNLWDKAHKVWQAAALVCWLQRFA